MVKINRILIKVTADDGTAIQEALDVGHEVVMTTEGDPEKYRALSNRFLGNPKVVIVWGDPRMMLRGLIQATNEPVTVIN